MSSWLAEALASSTLLMLLVLALRGPVARLFGPQVAYLLWLLPALRMILPPLPADIVASAPLTPLPLVLHRMTVSLPPGIDVRTTAPVDVATVVLGVWAACTAMWLAASLTAYAHFSSLVRRGAIVIGERDGVTLLASPHVDGPLALGVLRRAIVLPLDYAARYDAAELELAIRHELAHHTRRDLPANLLALALRSAHWFNPIAALAHRAFRADQELACDAAVLAGQGDAHTYGRALIKSASGRLSVAVCALGATDHLKRMKGCR